MFAQIAIARTQFDSNRIFALVSATKMHENLPTLAAVARWLERRRKKRSLVNIKIKTSAQTNNRNNKKLNKINRTKKSCLQTALDDQSAVGGECTQAENERNKKGGARRSQPRPLFARSLARRPPRAHLLTLAGRCVIVGCRRSSPPLPPPPPPSPPRPQRIVSATALNLHAARSAQTRAPRQIPQLLRSTRAMSQRALAGVRVASAGWRLFFASTLGDSLSRDLACLRCSANLANDPDAKLLSACNPFDVINAGDERAERR